MHSENQFILNQMFEQALDYHQSKDYKSAFEYFKEAADRGCLAAAYYVGVYLENGMGIHKDLKLAFQYYQLAANNENPQAQYRVGLSLKYGRGVEKSYEEAFNYFSLAAAVHLPEAFHEIADCYLRGLGVGESWEDALSYYNLASELGYEPSCSQQTFLLKLFIQKDRADNGNPEAQAEIGLKYRDGFQIKKSPFKAYEYLKRAADQGNIKGIYGLGCLYRYGEGVSRSDEIAISYLQESAHQGLIWAKNELLHYFKNGLEGLKQDYSQVINYYRSAADQGIAVAFYALGECYVFGRGVEVSWKEAISYYMKALEKGYQPAKDKLAFLDGFILLQNEANQGDVSAQLLVANEYLSGKCIQASKKIACNYFKLASDQGNVEASYALATHEQAINPWSQTAIFYFDRAAHQKHLQAIWILFEHYHYGQFCQELQEKALVYLRLGIELDHTECQYHLGVYYLRGFGGLTPSIEEAFKYFRLAAKKGHKGAFRSLEPRILHPAAEPVDISPYEKTQDIYVLKQILESFCHQPIFLEMTQFSWEEAQVIYKAMIENPHLTFMCPESEGSRLFLAFELAGYHPNKDLSCKPIVNPITGQGTWGYVFTAYDVKDSSLTGNALLEDDPGFIEEMRLKLLQEEEREKNKSKAYEIYHSLSKGDITYPDSREIDISDYLNDHDIDTFKSILFSASDSPTHLYMTGTIYEEIKVIRDAMIQNPRFCIFLSNLEIRLELEEAFYRAGYHDYDLCLKKQKTQKEEKMFWGYLFIGKNFQKLRSIVRYL